MKKRLKKAKKLQKQLKDLTEGSDEYNQLENEIKGVVIHGNGQIAGKRKTRRNRKTKKGKRSRKARKSRRKSNRRRGRR